MKTWPHKLIVAALVLALLGGAAAWYVRSGGDSSAVFRTAAVTRGDLLVTITATGTVEPEEVIDVGAEVAGQILSFGQDVDGKTVDYGSMVQEGTVLARIDDSVYTAELTEAQAQVQAAQAGVSRARSDREQMQAKLQQADRDWQRAQKLGPSEALSRSSFDAYQSAYDTAKANVAVGQASILQAQAQLAQAEAGFERAQRNLSYCVIKSPVKGVVIDRRVNIGQTVVASLNAPSLFLIAKDLRRMQVWVAVNEADVGKIQPGQPVSFTVDAFPGEEFAGEVGKVRLNASMTQNVVTYTVEVMTDNSAGRLLPYLTANVKFHVDRRQNVLLLPNAALRFAPSEPQISPQYRQADEDAESQDEAQTGPAQAATQESAEKWKPAVVWQPEGNYVRPLTVWAGLTDGTYTEIEGEGTEEGLAVVTAVDTQASSASASNDVTNPFTPKMPSRRPRGAGR